MTLRTQKLKSAQTTGVSLQQTTYAAVSEGMYQYVAMHCENASFSCLGEPGQVILLMETAGML